MNPFDFRYIGAAGEYIKEFWGGETSIAQVIDCPLCLSKGSYPEMDSEDDFIEKMCEGCSGKGTIIAHFI